MPSIPARLSSDQHIIDQVRSQPETTALSPRTIAGIQVPIVSNFRVVQTQSFSGGTSFTLAFDTPVVKTGNLDKYNIFYTLGSTTLDLAGVTVSSPCTFRIVTSLASAVTFTCQTVLKNGFVSNSENSPTCTGYTIAGTIDGSDIPDGSLGLNKLVGGAPGTLIVGQGLSSAPAYVAATDPSLDFVFGGTALTTAGLIPIVGGLATLTEDADLAFDTVDKEVQTPRIAVGENLTFPVGPPLTGTVTLDRTAMFYEADASGGAVDATLPADADSAIGQQYIIIATDVSNLISVIPDGTDNINGVNSPLTLTYVGATVRLIKLSANNWWIW